MVFLWPLSRIALLPGVRWAFCYAGQVRLRPGKALPDKPGGALLAVVILLTPQIPVRKQEGRRDFHAEPISDQTEALKLAKADAKAIPKIYKINPSALQGIEVNIWTPYKALEASEMQATRYYWEALFKAFGLGRVEVR